METVLYKIKRLIIRGDYKFTDNVPIYTKGAIKQFNGKDILYILISAKREGIV